MADLSLDLAIPDKRVSAIKRIITPVYAGDDTLTIKSPDLFGIPQIFKLIVAQIRLVCDATVQNRLPRLARYIDGVAYQNFLISRDAVTASQTQQFYFVDGAWTASGSAFENAIIGCNGKALAVGDKASLKAFIADGQAGDTWYGIFEFEYLNRLWGMAEVLPEGVK